MAESKIILKYGDGDPSTVLFLSEIAYDKLNNNLYVGNGIGEAATIFYGGTPVSSGWPWDSINGGSSWSEITYDYVYGGFNWVTTIADRITGGSW